MPLSEAYALFALLVVGASYKLRGRSLALVALVAVAAGYFALVALITSRM